MSQSSRSKIWEYYEVNAVNATKANCLICKQKLKRGGNDPRSFGTSSLINHLRAKHRNEFKEYSGINLAAKERKLEDEAQSPANKCARRQFKQVRDAKFEKQNPSVLNHFRHSTITKRIGEMIASDLLAFNIVSKVGFIRMIHELEPRYIIPSASYFSGTLIPDMYVAVKNKVKELLDASTYISFTTDLFTSDNNLNEYLSLTAHWIDTDWNRKSVLLSLRNVEDSHTGQVISNTILDMLDSWEIPCGKRGVLVRDNGASMVKAAQLIGLDHLGCYIHAIQLIVNHGLSVQRAVIDAIATARTFVGRFRHSTEAAEQLNKIQKSFRVDGTHCATHCLIQDVSTSWTSTFYMLERLIEQKHAIEIYCQDNPGVKSFTPDEWNLVEHLLTTLRPFEEETRNASLATGNVGMIIPSVKVLKMTLTKPRNAGDDFGIQRMRADMLMDLETRFAEIESSKVCALATVLDPTFKLIVFSAVSQDTVKQMLLDEIICEANKSKPVVRQLPTSVTLNSEIKPSTSLDAFYQEMFDTSSINVKLEAIFDSTELACQQQMNAYLAEAHQPRTTPPTDPIVYWKSREHIYPMLAALAKRFFATPPSSINTERTFSTAGVISNNACSDKLSQMTASTTEMLLFLQKNLNVTNYQY